MSLEFQKKPIHGRVRPSIKSLKRAPYEAKVPTRPDTDLIRPGTNLERLARRDARRASSRQAARQEHRGRPRPAVRPLSPPSKMMPKTVSPQPGRLSRARKIVRPSSQKLKKVGSVSAAAAVSLVGLNLSAAHEQIASEASTLASALDDLRSRSEFPQVREEMSDLEALLDRIVQLLEGARQKGFRYQSELEKLTYDAISQWEAVHPQVESGLNQHSDRIQKKLPQLNPRIQRLNDALSNASTAAPLLQQTQTRVNRLLQEIARIEGDLEARYEDIQEQAWSINSRLGDIHWAMTQFDESKFSFESGEDLVMAVPTRWDKEGKDDPEGVLFLTNKRVLFERKEKVAIKKVLFITTASELVQESLIDQKLEAIESVKAANKGLFGHQDFIEITFADPQAGRVNLHIDGQDSEAWSRLVERARSGQIEDERVVGLGGLSIDEMSRELNQADIIALQNEVSDLQDELMLKDVHSEIAGLEHQIHALERKLSKARARGYLVEKELEADFAVLKSQWERIKSNTEATLTFQSGILSEQMAGVQKDMASLTGMADDLERARPIYMRIKSTLASAEAQADAAEATVLAQYDLYADEIESLDTHLDWVYWMLEALSSASFRLLATESGVAAAEATYHHSDGEPESGILFLTDQRLLWEDRVGDFELKVDVPIQKVQDIQKEALAPSEGGVAESLVFRFGSGQTLPGARFNLTLPLADAWLTMVARARNGDYRRDRVVEISQEELERIRNAPQQCNNCGAAFTAPILRGQTEINCEYCGSATRI